MFLSILDFAMELGMVYLLAALFIILHLLLLSARAHRRRGERTDRDARETLRDAEAQEEREAFEKRHAPPPAAP